MSSQDIKQNSNDDILNEYQVKENNSPKAIPISELAVKLPKSAKLSSDHTSQKYRNIDDPLLEDDRITKSKNSPKTSESRQESKIKTSESKSGLVNEKIEIQVMTEEKLDKKLKEFDDIEEPAKIDTNNEENNPFNNPEIFCEENSGCEKAPHTYKKIIPIEEKQSEILEKVTVFCDEVLPLASLNKTNMDSNVTDSSTEKTSSNKNSFNNLGKAEGILEKISKSNFKGNVIETETKDSNSDPSENNSEENKPNNQTLKENKESPFVKSNYLLY